MNWIIDKILKFTGSQKFLSIQLDITNNCNLNCVHCYQSHHSKNENLSFQDWCNILDQYTQLTKKLHLKPHFGISGGEPTLSPLFLPLLQEINSRWPEAGISVLTNGTNFSNSILDVMTRFNIDTQISIDGSDSERNDIIRGQGNFNRAMQGIRALQKAGLNATFQAVLSYRTAQWIEDFFDTALQVNAAAMNFTRFVPQGKGISLKKAGNDRPLVGLELRDAYSSIITASSRTGISTGTNLPLFVLVDPELGSHGKAGFQGLVVDYKGNLKVTSRANFKLGNIFEDGLENLFLRHPIMDDLRNGKIEGCGSCKFYERCGGDRNASFVAYGSFLKKDPGCWFTNNK